MKAADRRGLTCMQEKPHTPFFFYLHKLPFAAALRIVFPSWSQKQNIQALLKASVDKLYKYNIPIRVILIENAFPFLLR